MGVRTPQRDMLGRWSPRQIFEFGEHIQKNLLKEAEERKATRIPSGKISGGKLANPTLWAVLDVLGLGKDFDAYTLGKFQRGHDVEARAINFLTGIPLQKIVDILDGSVPNPGWIKTDASSMLAGEIYLQLEGGYRGGTGFIDLAQRVNGKIIYHEIKSSTKMAYDKVAASGRSASGTPSPYDHHCIQLAYYCLGDGVNTAFVHYFNADDYRLCSFSINPLDYQEEIDREIDDIQAAFLTKTLPPFEALLDFHKVKGYQSYGDEWNKLTPDQMLTKLQNEYPEAYTRFMTMTLPTETIKKETT